ncbi:PAS domain-containing sensor histidine kinase [Mucilaginibacter sp. UR6-11]|uniref:PAS domain-containing sensor histidine kinase n=1 Tax=Mucilaginibacter sp. UR6-11 TaxID=1435644 RepID=UPI001E412C62|nr:PAS domain-containing sensor histidine kinase [Mucilaginibacter sp. UR6-11]MCC8423999.1 PAS domain-containing sensor histidine kinase [Mucilaginibacter sp. UR6-11]
MITNNPLHTTNSHYLQGGGEMGQLIRDFDWDNSVLGSPEDWSQSLLTTVSIILSSKFPMFLWWGPQLIQFYNDAYRPSLGQNGKHPKALGQRGEDCWPEIWPVIKPLIDTVLEGGESTWSENQLIPIYRNNKLEDVYWTFSYSRVTDETGTPGGVLVICTETTEQVQSYNKIQSAKNELEFAIEAADLGTWDLDPKTNKFICNDRLKEWFGLPADEEIALESAVAAIADEDRERVIEAIKKSMASGSDGNYNVIYTVKSLKDGTRRIVEATGRALFDTEGMVYQFSGILQDVTEEYQLQVRKDEFISVASHELKTPITSLSASIQILQKLVKSNPTSDKVPVFVNKASNNLNKLIHLLDDLLNVTKIQQGQLALNINRFDLVELIKDCCEHINPLNEYEFAFLGDDTLMIYADYRRIDQVMINLIGNAIKYSPQSKRIEITVMHDDERATVCVRDFGIGINPQKLPHLFDRYYRVDAFGHQFSGLGLGLYISSEIITRHNGKIGVDSTVGDGSNFWFNLPIDDKLGL